MEKSKSSMDLEIAVNLCHQFEQEWSADEKTNLKRYLKQVEKAHRGEAFKMLIEIEIDRRNAVGQDVDPEDYVKFGDGAYQLVRRLVARGPQFDETEAREPQQKSNLTIHFKSDQIGPYKLLEEIGSGGMGMVWVAEQAEPVYRKVALKLVKPELGSSELIARFDAERQALAMMDHPNIAKFLDAGTTEEGTPYFAMELVQGTPINQFCDRNQVSVHDRLQVFISVCRAVQHAHQKGIIHRDLKPTNILVQMEDGNPTAKVIDFGLAKALDQSQKLTDKTLYTEFGHVIGTIQYMSPEQATLDAMGSDSRSDIYSLGVVLFELLVGSTPIDRKTVKDNAFLKVLELVREKEPPRPSARLMETENQDEVLRNRCIQMAAYRQVLESDLDWVVVKALEKDPARRYETANQLARELERIINGEPIEARPPSISYRFGKFVRKNRIMVGSSIAGISLVLFFLVITSFLALRTTDFRIAAEKAKSDLHAAENERDQAIHKYQELRREDEESELHNGKSEKGGQSSKSKEKESGGQASPKKGILEPSGKSGKDAGGKNDRPDGNPQSPNKELFDELLDLQLNQLSANASSELPRLKKILKQLPPEKVIEVLKKHGISFSRMPSATKKKDGRRNWMNPGFPQDDMHPVVNVNYYDANAFCKWLSKETGKTYYIPTGQEWEYGCRAGTTTLFQNGDDPEKLTDVGNVEGEIDGHLMTAPVGQFQPNGFGLYDMHGNVMEWTSDHLKGESGLVRVRRGGAFSSGKPWELLRVSYKYADDPEIEGDASGFRVVREADESDKTKPLIVDSIGIRMRLLPAGLLKMGDDRGTKEKTTGDSVKFDQPFYMGTHEVTVGQFRKFVKATGYRTYAEENGGSYARLPLNLTPEEKVDKLFQLMASRFEPRILEESSIVGAWVLADKAPRIFRLPG